MMAGIFGKLPGIDFSGLYPGARREAGQSPMPGSQPIQPAFAPVPEQQMQQIKPRTGFNAPGGLGEKLGILGGLLMAQGGSPAGGAMLGNIMAQRRDRQQQAFDSAEYDRRRQDGLDDWRWKQEWERQNPRPVNNDTQADFDYIKSILGEDAARRFLENKTDPVVSVPLPNGTYVGPRSGMSSAVGGQGVPTAPVGKLRPIGGPGPGQGGFR